MKHYFFYFVLLSTFSVACGQDTAIQEKPPFGLFKNSKRLSQVHFSPVVRIKYTKDIAVPYVISNPAKSDFKYCILGDEYTLRLYNYTLSRDGEFVNPIVQRRIGPPKKEDVRTLKTGEVATFFFKLNDFRIKPGNYELTLLYDCSGNLANVEPLFLTEAKFTLVIYIQITPE